MINGNPKTARRPRAYPVPQPRSPDTSPTAGPAHRAWLAGDRKHTSFVVINTEGSGLTVRYAAALKPFARLILQRCVAHTCSLDRTAHCFIPGQLASKHAPGEIFGFGACFHACHTMTGTYPGDHLVNRFSRSRVHRPVSLSYIASHRHGAARNSPHHRARCGDLAAPPPAPRQTHPALQIVTHADQNAHPGTLVHAARQQRACSLTRRHRSTGPRTGALAHHLGARTSPVLPIPAPALASSISFIMPASNTAHACLSTVSHAFLRALSLRELDVPLLHR